LKIILQAKKATGLLWLYNTVKRCFKLNMIQLYGSLKEVTEYINITTHLCNQMQPKTKQLAILKKVDFHWWLMMI